ncbi:MAG TPA: hypothetical protein VHW74_16380 [Mycobacteriales bacterium]|nr:hypothetical protein [Mycobacteriales bacterium]
MSTTAFAALPPAQWPVVGVLTSDTALLEKHLSINVIAALVIWRSCSALAWSSGAVDSQSQRSTRAAAAPSACRAIRPVL